MVTEKTKTKTSFGCLMIFLSPFVIMGLGALIKGIYTYSQNPVFTEDVIALLGVGGMFTLVGGAFMAAVIYGKKKSTEDDIQKEKHPDTPWLWQQDWAEGRIKSATPLTMFVYWLFGLAFGGIGFFVTVQAWDEITAKGAIGYLVLLFPLVGVYMTGLAIYATIQWAKYGRVYLDLVTKPGVIGGWFQGIIWAKIDLAPSDTLEANITCYHCYTSGSGDNRSSHRDVKWQETFSIPQNRMRVQPDGTLAIPIKVYIPRKCKATTPGSPESRMEWELSAKAEVAGIDFASQFIIPVFVTDDSSDIAPEHLEDEISNPPEPYSPTILITESMNGIELYAPPRRSLSALSSITIFTTLWTAIVAGMIFIDSGIPILFPLVFGFFNFILLWIAAWMWFGKARVRVEFDTIHLSKTILGIGSRSTLTTSEVTDIDEHITMQSGNIPYYTVRLHTTSGKKNTVGGIRNKDEAQDLVKRLKKSCGLA